ncbi:MAG: ABC transporter ATP-binding protein [Acidobacteria bacterium]|nr:MAG: ABC transporter ATP-binding protein [Acidobacteriota bacterium]
MRLALETVSLSKTFRRWRRGREVRALSDVSFTVDAGAIFGLLGPNGAGKTTLVKVALTIAHADRGEVRLLGQSIRDRSVFSRVGYLPENPRFPLHLTAWQVLRLYGSLSGADMTAVERNASRWLERLDLARWSDMRVSKFSKGMNERLAFAQALVHDPELIFLDEPTDGLDPLARMEVRNICRELADQGKTVFINSHILAEIELICDRIALMKSGEIVEQGTISELTASRGGYELVAPAVDGLGHWLGEKSLTFAAVDGHFHVQLADRVSANALIDALRAKNIEIESLSVKRRTLESVFIERLSRE